MFFVLFLFRISVSFYLQSLNKQVITSGTINNEHVYKSWFFSYVVADDDNDNFMSFIFIKVINT